MVAVVVPTLRSLAAASQSALHRPEPPHPTAPGPSANSEDGHFDSQAASSDSTVDPTALSEPPGAETTTATGRLHVRMPRVGTVGRLAAFHALIIASVLGIVVFQFTQAFSNRYRTTIISDLTENVASYSRAAADRPGTQSLALFTRNFLATHGPAAADYLIVALPADHLILGTPGSARVSRVSAINALLTRPPKSSVLTQATLNGAPEMVLAVPINDHGRTVGTFLTTGSLTNYEATTARIFGLAAWEGAITLLAAFVSVYVLLRRLLGSIRRLTRTAADIGLSGELGVRLDDEQGSDEVGEMAATFNAMIDKIDSAVTLQRQMMADVSHQLRTPLTVARGHLEVMSRGSLDDPARTRETVSTVIDELAHMNRLVERLLLLGRSLESDFTDVCPVDVRALLLDLADAVEMLAPRHWAVGPIPDVVVYADLDKLRGAIFNLVENSVHATHSDDSIRLSARIGGTSDDPMVEIVVDDSGPGIPLDERQSVLGRFSRPSATGIEGTGIGLAIVGAVARGHGGHVSIGDSPLGGCRAIIAIPLPRPGDEYPTIAEDL